MPRSIRFGGILCLVGIVLGGGSALPAAVRPNVLLIITDDQGYGDFGFTGNPILKTPVIDQLAKESYSFRHFYVHSFCAPTRAALLTGRYPHRSGVSGVTSNKEYLPASEVTIAEALKGGGYRTGCFGKWHNGEQYPMTPPGQGFDEFFGFNNGHFNNYFNATLLDGAQPVETQGYLPDVTTDAAIRFMEARRSEPFFCYVAYNTPHSPHQVPDREYDAYASQGLPHVLAAFFGMCANIDENVGRMLDTLKSNNLDDKTVVIFMTDNGGTAGVNFYNAGMRGKKGSAHEGGSRVPLLIRSPESRKTPREIDQLAAHIDLYPTILQMCSIPAPPGPRIDGVSLVPLFTGQSHGAEERSIFLNGGGMTLETSGTPGAVRTPQYRLVREKEGQHPTAWQLYDMLADPGETTDLAAERPQIVQELAASYDVWLKATLQHNPPPVVLPIGYQQQNPVILNATSARFSGSLSYTLGPGYAHDWLSKWTDTTSRVWFDVDFVHPGTYEFEVLYACAPDQAGSTLQLTAQGEQLSQTVPAGESPALPAPDNATMRKQRFTGRSWTSFPLGELKLKSGKTRLELQCTELAHESALEFKGLSVRRVQP
ncbi:arylsulfatase [Planctomicrobium sp. SH664]|uniref:arylsulfatase n=1 Tax=Planctomicrobium sp. SH664 TaxID=3448125 RepID=UPI003F5BBCAF